MKLRLASALASTSALALLFLLGSGAAAARANTNERARSPIGPTCVACVSGALRACKKPLDRCLGEPGCAVAALCLQDCADAGCAERCEALAGTGTDSLDALKACAICARCAQACDGPELGCD